MNGPRCSCCAHIWAEGRSRNVPAFYLWISANSGNRFYLCASCCASWRENAAGDPSLAPSRIAQVRVI